MGLLRWARAPFAAVTLLRPLSQCMLFLLRLSFKGGSLDGCPWCHFLSTLGLLEVDGQVGVTCSHDTQSCAIGVHRMPVTGTVSFFGEYRSPVCVCHPRLVTRVQMVSSARIDSGSDKEHKGADPITVQSFFFYTSYESERFMVNLRGHFRLQPLGTLELVGFTV